MKVLRDVLCHSTDWLNIFMTDLGMSVVMALCSDRIILDDWTSVVE